MLSWESDIGWDSWGGLSGCEASGLLFISFSNWVWSGRMSKSESGYGCSTKSSIWMMSKTKYCLCERYWDPSADLHWSKWTKWFSSLSMILVIRPMKVSSGVRTLRVLPLAIASWACCAILKSMIALSRFWSVSSPNARSGLYRSDWFDCIGFLGLSPSSVVWWQRCGSKFDMYHL